MVVVGKGGAKEGWRWESPQECVSPWDPIKEVNNNNLSCLESGNLSQFFFMRHLVSGWKGTHSTL